MCCQRPHHNHNHHHTKRKRTQHHAKPQQRQLRRSQCHHRHCRQQFCCQHKQQHKQSIVEDADTDGRTNGGTRLGVTKRTSISKLLKQHPEERGELALSAVTGEEQRVATCQAPVLQQVHMHSLTAAFQESHNGSSCEGGICLCAGQ